ncbi:MAG: TIGR03986 family CRISPR-associated RAMP protein [bacterium]
MPDKGRIKSLVEGKGYGFIKPEGAGKDIFFHASALKSGARFDDLQVGTEVEFDTEDSEKGTRAARVSIIGKIEHKIRETTGYRFLNPYNFVRILLSSGAQSDQDTPAGTLADKLRAAGLGSDPTQPETPTESALLGKCQPPPHDRFVGLSGKIECIVENVTPLFIGDAEKRVVAKSGHSSVEFFKMNGQPAIPATSLRGPIRSLFEAATNSCLINLSDAQLSYHFSPGKALKLVPARVEKDGAKWRVRLLPGSKPVNAPRNDPNPQHAAWLPQYLGDVIWGSRNTKGTSDYAQRQNVKSGGLKHQDSYYALLHRMKHPQKHFWFWNVKELAKPEDKVRLGQPGKGERIEEGYVCITNQNIENKHDERFFFNSGGLERAKCLELKKKVVRDYENLIRDYQQRHDDGVSKRKSPGEPEGNKSAYSRFIINKQEADLTDGALVYALIDEVGEVEFIAPVSIPRRSYKNKINQLLPDSELLRCKSHDKLCPACRTFGWTRLDKNEDAESDIVAYAGRVKFSHARLLESKGILPETPLAILSSPKPTTTLFYLQPASEQEIPEKWDSVDQERGYEGENHLRGRKFYRHHRKISTETYRRMESKCDDQNHTVRDALAKGAKFSFSVNFENLAPLELGALLWSLEMDNSRREKKMHHRLGFGKPLGFGSCLISVKNIELLRPAERYATFGGNGFIDAMPQKDELIMLFKERLATHYKADSFENLPNIEDLVALLSVRKDDLPIHYPRTSRVPDPEGKNFEWFVGNKRGEKITLPPAAKDTGLPLITRDGRSR